jgi:exodeoxyribonuclease V alpha subunit
MQIRNNYEKEVFNGDVGRVTSIDSEDGRLVVTFPTGTGSIAVEYETADLDELVLAYAVSVHKAQGSEFPCVIMPLVNRHFILLQRNLLYTAITRARRLCVLVGSKRALALAAGTDKGVHRNTRLVTRVRSPGTEALQLDLV